MKIALLDLYDGTPNMGMHHIKEIIKDIAAKEGVEYQLDIFDIRGKCESPDLSYNIYISSGGPGSPLDTEGSEWEKVYFELVNNIINHNTKGEDKKNLFLICHSFQLFCRYYGFGKVCERNKPSFGIYPTVMTEAGKTEPFYQELSNPFWIADFRKYQVINPNESVFDDWGAKLLSIEKERPHLQFEPAMMSIRFTDEIFGTQFHPEADPEGMLFWFQDEEKKKQLIDEHGEEKYDDMLEHLRDPDKLEMTFGQVLPNFLYKSFQSVLHEV